ncbi:phage tail assembly protein T [Alteromonas sp. 76-1]|uniref:phage tail assembly protein T n=1 Tax=Alteromonas sp. 76-1 TaxID=2358187 RepID=UPI00101C3739|nr:hypothetical protein [Alteromonas sp. 76-1]
MRLALKLGQCDADHFLRKLSASQLLEWFRFAELEPFGARVEQMQTAGLRAQVANYLRKKGSEPFTAQDFVLGYKPQVQPKQMSVEELYRRFTGQS